jgi:hypothetical protein
MNTRKPTLEELFSVAHKQDLIKKQSEHFVSNALSEGNFESGYKNMPSNFPSSPDNFPLIVNSKTPQLLIGTYLKHHWRPLLIVLIVGGIATYVYLKSKEKKKKKSDGNKIPKHLYYNLPKKSI